MLDLSKIINIRGFGTITDKTDGTKILFENAIHYGNISAAIAKALAGLDDGHARYMVFGNGGTSIATTGQISYRAPNVSVVRDNNAALYNQTYSKDMLDNADADSYITTNLTNANYADLKFVATLGYGEPAGQDTLDTALNNDGDYVFDELGIQSEEGLLLSHVIFHPVQKSLNREFEVEYTIRIQMGVS
jgi:hypothetical protein